MKKKLNDSVVLAPIKNISVPHDLVGMGYIAGAFGVRGWVKVHADTEYPDSLFDYDHWWLKYQGVWTLFHLIEGNVHTKALAAKLEGVDDRDQAVLLRGSEIAIPRSLMPSPEEDSYYWTDLIGLAVVNMRQEALGRVEQLLETGANDVLVVKNDTTECLIPFVKAVVKRVDLSAGIIEVEWEVDF